jgi:hypothetical protein
LLHMDGVTEAENPAREEVWVSMGVQRFFARQGVWGGDFDKRFISRFRGSAERAL